MTNKHMKQCSTSLTIKETQSKTSLRFYLTPVRLASIKKTTKADEDVGRKEPLIHCCGECKLLQLLWKSVWRFLKKLKIEL
jgi:hypothetical protein